MYEELVRRLKETTVNHADKCESCPYEEDYFCCVDCLDEMHIEAADAIEELSKRETPMKITEIHVDEYYCPACGAENNCDQGYVQDAYCPACGQRLFPEPPKAEMSKEET